MNPRTTRELDDIPRILHIQPYIKGINIKRKQLKDKKWDHIAISGTTKANTKNYAADKNLTYQDLQFQRPNVSPNT